MAITPPADVLSNELIKEFADRCLSASRSIQGYMAANDPAPDNDTMEGLIDTNEQLQQALNHHQRAVLNARKILGLNERSSGASSPSLPPPINEQTRPNGSGASAANSVPRLNAPPLPQRKSIGNGKGKAADVWKTPALASGSGSGSGLGSGFGSGSAGPLQPTSGTSSRREDEESGQDPFRDASEHGVDSNDGSRLAYEHFHPGGFNGNTSTWASGATSSGKAQVAAEPVTPVSDDEDLYHATPQRTGGADSGGKGTSSRY